MPALSNPRHEHFAVLVAGGVPPTQAYLAAGFSGKGAAQSASRLVRVAAVANRIAELRNRNEGRVRNVQERVFDAQTDAPKTVSLDLGSLRERVIKNLVDLADQSKKEGKLATSARCEQLLGMAAGVFTEAKEPEWDGDFGKLSKAQRMKLQHTMEQEIYGDDTARLEADKAAWLKEREARRKADAEAAGVTEQPKRTTVQ